LIDDNDPGEPWHHNAYGRLMYRVREVSIARADVFKN
jgi:hypothetical protein